MSSSSDKGLSKTLNASLSRTSPASQRTAVLSLASLFFVCGFSKVANNTLQPHLHAVFNLSYAQTTLIGSVWFLGYFAVSLPAATLIERIGYRRSLVVGLLAMSTGALLMIEAVRLASYMSVLVALFAMAAGATLLEVAANPYVALVGAPETASSRLNLVQAFNAVGSMAAPLFGSWLLLSRSRAGVAGDAAVAAFTPSERLADAQAVDLPYLIVAVILAGLAVVIAWVDLPEVSDRKKSSAKLPYSQLWRHPSFVTGLPAIAAYMLAEIGCASLFINLVCQPTTAGLTPVRAADYLFFLWAGMMVGRLTGSMVMRRVTPAVVLASASVLAFIVLIVTVVGHGPLVMWALISVGLFHSIMFPTIFTLAIRDLGALTKMGSGLLIMAIGGGSLVFMQGWMADKFGPQISFVIPAICELYILFFAMRGSRQK